jgi:hypothetical protein
VASNIFYSPRITQEKVLEGYLRLSLAHSGPLTIGALLTQALTDFDYAETAKSNPNHPNILKRQKILRDYFKHKTDIRGVFLNSNINKVDNKFSIGAIETQRSSEIFDLKDKQFKLLIEKCFRRAQSFDAKSAKSMREIVEICNEIIQEDPSDFINIAPNGCLTEQLIDRRFKKNNLGVTRIQEINNGWSQPSIFYYYTIKDNLEDVSLDTVKNDVNLEVSRRPERFFKKVAANCNLPITYFFAESEKVAGSGIGITRQNLRTFFYHTAVLRVTNALKTLEDLGFVRLINPNEMNASYIPIETDRDHGAQLLGVEEETLLELITRAYRPGHFSSPREARIHCVGLHGDPSSVEIHTSAAQQLSLSPVDGKHTVKLITVPSEPPVTQSPPLPSPAPATLKPPQPVAAVASFTSKKPRTTTSLRGPPLTPQQRAAEALEAEQLKAEKQPPVTQSPSPPSPAPATLKPPQTVVVGANFNSERTTTTSLRGRYRLTRQEQEAEDLAVAQLKAESAAAKQR